MGSEDSKNKREKPSADEADLFYKEMANVKPGRQDKIEPPRKRLKPIPRQLLQDQEQVVEDMLRLDQDQLEVETGDELFYSTPGLQHTVSRKLRRGNYQIEAELDLHGFTVAEAGPLLNGFLADCHHRGMRCVRIIHGKGHGSQNQQPVLKHQLNNWLRRRKDTLAFCSARPYDGGTGAIYLLIRR